MRQCEHGCNGCENCTDYEGTHLMTTLEHAARDVPEALRLADQYDQGDPAAHGNKWKTQVCTELRRLQAEVEALRGGWRPIETAPKDGTLIVVRGNNYGDNDQGHHHCIATWHNGCWMEASDWNATSELTYLTHYMPLPTPPAQEDGND